MNNDKDTIKYPISILGNLQGIDCSTHNEPAYLNGECDCTFNLQEHLDCALSYNEQYRFQIERMKSDMMKQSGQYAEVVKKLDAEIKGHDLSIGEINRLTNKLDDAILEIERLKYEYECLRMSK